MIEPHVFGPFARMVEKLPTKAIIASLELEYRMLRNDLERHRYGLTAEVRSILYFLEFIQTAKLGEAMCFVTSFPSEYIEFFRQTLVRLIEANELPRDTLQKFDHFFSPGDISLAA
jgi:hypothetical protein